MRTDDRGVPTADCDSFVERPSIREAQCRLDLFKGSHIPCFLFGAVLCLSLLALTACGPAPDARQSQDGFRWPERILTLEERQQEAAAKVARVVGLLRREQLAGLLITTPANLSWITAGSERPVPVVITSDGRRFLLADVPEGTRLLSEDLKGMGFELKEISWEKGQPEGGIPDAVLQELAGGQPIASDAGCARARLLGRELAGLRVPLTPTEIREYRWLGQRCAEAVESICRRIQPGMTERGVESLLSGALLRFAIRPKSIRVSSDERIRNYGPAPPSDEKKVEKSAMVGVTACRWGLHISLSRIVHVGPVPDELRKATDAAASVNAGLWARTLPGATIASILQGAHLDYSNAGFPGEEAKGDLGGAIGYMAPDLVAGPGANQPVLAGQAFAWQPTVQGVCVGDTILLDGENLEILTRTPDWPVIESRSLGHIYRSPGILVR